MLCSYYEQCLNKHECAGSLCMTTLISLANYPGMVQLDSVVVLFTVSQETSILISIMVVQDSHQRWRSVPLTPYPHQQVLSLFH